MGSTLKEEEKIDFRLKIKSARLLGMERCMQEGTYKEGCMKIK